MALAWPLAWGLLVRASALEFWGAGAMSAIGRNPEAAGQITTNMILAIAFAEALGIYALIVSVILLFVV